MKYEFGDGTKRENLCIRCSSSAEGWLRSRKSGMLVFFFWIFLKKTNIWTRKNNKQTGSGPLRYEKNGWRIIKVLSRYLYTTTTPENLGRQGRNKLKKFGATWKRGKNYAFQKFGLAFLARILTLATNGSRVDSQKPTPQLPVEPRMKGQTRVMKPTHPIRLGLALNKHALELAIRRRLLMMQSRNWI